MNFAQNFVLYGPFVGNVTVPTLFKLVSNPLLNVYSLSLVIWLADQVAAVTRQGQSREPFKSSRALWVSESAWRLELGTFHF